MQEICDTYNILLIVDEVMSGFGRTGEWFGINHYPFVKPDIMAIAKGVTSGYVPLGGTIVSKEISDYFNTHVLWGGLTYSAHALACAAGVATLEVYHQENLIERSRDMGKVLRRHLMDLAEKHPVVGEIRGTGLHQVIELVKNRDTREPLRPYNRRRAAGADRSGLCVLTRGGAAARERLRNRARSTAMAMAPRSR